MTTGSIAEEGGEILDPGQMRQQVCYAPVCSPAGAARRRDVAQAG
ncbi:hypothetical protein [Tessaracoccus sp. OH4464_COT-324]|nr:hypothetical protein [Tessaracoccus sp. OH4464_COT-324]